MRRFPLALVLVGALGLLAAGGAVLGAFQAPTGTDLAVHNGAGQTLLATRVVGSYTSSELPGTTVKFDFTAPDHLVEKAVEKSGKVEGRRTVSGSEATGVLTPVRNLLSIRGFSVHGAYYENTQPAANLVTPAERPDVTGTYRTRVELESGYVVGVFIRINAAEGTERVAETVDYRLSRIDGWMRSR